DLAHDLFGSSVMISGVAIKAKCQSDVLQAAGKALTSRWESLRKCQRDHYKDTTDDASLKAACLEPQQVDTLGSIARASGTVSKRVQTKCLNHSLSGLGASLFPGACTASADGAIGACIARQAACRFCVAVNSAEAIVPPVDCDMFDDANL